ncbi:hypothetical protein NEUTE1DRAFT_61313 [Neurospora tetrasperma FGSC 2508]|uniref:P-loop containing nucleoside triphosphate hydrolase protein n=1 Tax=Neurospora tetrasperma (strain FGSC 2508 / ATCC MYA-4615 / P0657) TaxID=510951 RepID=F8MHR9_NEUT8|nr:uncharacterized protein NEUTE1DRAFT_61313 [Neurospora tetrasperma FGSC 2508]EGO59680.1 hypothetical protein NEUTE1DRAFT_61313 [Neurospora tetrasperma FGSC 2508]
MAHQNPTEIQLHLIPLIPNILSALLILVDRPRTVRRSLFIIAATLLFFQLTITTLAPDAIGTTWKCFTTWGGGICVTLASIVAMLNMPLRDPLLNSSKIGKPFAKPESSVRSPEDIVTLWQWMSVSWMAPLISTACKRQLHDKDVWLLASDFQHQTLHLLFRDLTGTVLVRLLKANGLDIVLTTCLGTFETLAELSEPVLLKQLLNALMSEIPAIRAAVVYASFILIARVLKAHSAVFKLWYERRNYERSRGEMITMIHDKTLRRKAFTIAAEVSTPSSQTSTLLGDENDTLEDINNEDAEPSQPWSLRSWVRGVYQAFKHKFVVPSQREKEAPASTGKILNLLRGDVYEVAQRFWEASTLITKPLSVIVSVVLLWKILGSASLFGIIVIGVGMVVNYYMTRLLERVEQERRATTDVKLERTSQFVESLRHLRWYDWQDRWLGHIMEIRQKELFQRVKSNVVNRSINVINNITSYMFPVVGFAAYTLILHRPLTVDIAFPALGLFTMLQNNLRDLPSLYTSLTNARVAMRRIEDFMLEPDKDDNEDDETATPAFHQSNLEISIRNASFSWPGSDTTVLDNISFVCEPGLTLVCGKVGIGKTALLQAILGELDQHSGEKNVPAEMIGYCAQMPWLESMSIRDNILFSTPFDEARYWQVLRACCLVEDLRKFKGGDRSLIGENGTGLSGGQRARVALARAVYSRSRILLLDDPIAALDHQTAETISRNIFADQNSPLTAGRLIVLVTHRVDIVKQYAYQVLDIVPGGQVKTFKRREIAEHEKELEAQAATAPDSSPIAESSTSQNTEDSSSEEEAELATVAGKFIQEEHRVHGGVMATVYWQYVKAGKLAWWATMVTLCLLIRMTNLGYNWFLKEWGEQYRKSTELGDRPHIFISHPDFKADGIIEPGRHLPPPGENVRPWLICLAIIALVQVLFEALSDLALIAIMYNAGKSLFAKAMRCVTNATFRFYDVTPVGRLMNRLTSDMGTIDGQIAVQVLTLAFYSLGWMTSMFVIATATPVFIVPSVGMTMLFVYLYGRYLPASQDLRRLETVSLSPLMSNFGTLLEGLTTVRAFRAEPHFQNRIIATTDDFQKMDHIYWSLQAWLQYRFDLVSGLSVYALTLTAIIHGLSSGMIGFVLAAAANFVESTHQVCRRYGDMQMQFVSVERIIELLSLEQEQANTDNPPPAGWPSCTDDIVFDKVTLRYAPEFDPVLVGVSLVIPGGSTVAVTGRTGSGKSTLAYALLSTIQPDAGTGGQIRIGSVDIAKVDKHILRRHITFVAQDPVLFAGTLRDNLDPLDEHSEDERAQVLKTVLNNGFTLDTRVDGGGKNLSQGQRQLVGLGRAILRRSAIVIMDEATASIDVETATYIHQLLRMELRHSTVITIAHKVEAVKDADFEIVLDKGRVVKAGRRVPKS